MFSEENNWKLGKPKSHTWCMLVRGLVEGRCTGARFLQVHACAWELELSRWDLLGMMGKRGDRQCRDARRVDRSLLSV